MTYFFSYAFVFFFGILTGAAFFLMLAMTQYQKFCREKQRRIKAEAEAAEWRDVASKRGES